MALNSFKESWQIGDIIRAPGKLVLAGEYAILDGAPAVVLAINRGVECEVAEGNGFSTPMNDTRFIDHARPLTKHHKLIFRDWNPVSEIASDCKPGFGGSGAACVIATRLMDMSWKSALQIHRQVQGGGSGIDVKASILGGMFIWDPKEENTHALSPYNPVVVWTGQSAKTGPRVQQYLNYNNREWFVRNSIRFTQLFLENPITGTQALYKNLVMMSRESGLSYLTPNIESIVALANQCGGAAKPSGAGGGDCIVAFFDTLEKKQLFVEEINTHPIFCCIDYDISQGVHIVKKSD